MSLNFICWHQTFELIVMKRAVYSDDSCPAMAAKWHIPVCSCDKYWPQMIRCAPTYVSHTCIIEIIPCKSKRFRLSWNWNDIKSTSEMLGNKTNHGQYFNIISDIDTIIHLWSCKGFWINLFWLTTILSYGSTKFKLTHSFEITCNFVLI